MFDDDVKDADGAGLTHSGITSFNDHHNNNNNNLYGNLYMIVDCFVFFCHSLTGSLRTSFLSGSKVNVTWHLAYAHVVSDGWGNYGFHIKFQSPQLSLKIYNIFY